MVAQNWGPGPPQADRPSARHPAPSVGVAQASSSMLALLPPGATAFEVSLATEDLPPGPRRREEFLAGRAAATAALGGLDLDGHVGQDADRRPVWPAGVVGSIAHCGHLAVAVAAPGSNVRALGVDVEDLADIGRELTEVVLTPAEQRALAGSGVPALLGVYFSAKESAFKCWSPLLGVGLDWPDIEVGLDHSAGAFTALVVGPTARLVATPVHGRYAVRDAHVLSAAWVNCS